MDSSWGGGIERVVRPAAGLFHYLDQPDAAAASWASLARPAVAPGSRMAVGRGERGRRGPPQPVRDHSITWRDLMLVV
jgi:hypothetical protein